MCEQKSKKWTNSKKKYCKMNKQNYLEERLGYLSPSVEVAEVSVERGFSASFEAPSDGGTENYEEGTFEW